MSGTSAVNFPGFPGAWTPGEPIEADEFVRVGAVSTVDELRDLAAELDLPLEEVDVAAGSAPMPVQANHRPSERQRRAEIVDEATKGHTIRTHAQADKAAAELDLVFGPDVETVADKVAAIEDFKTGAAALTLDEEPKE